MAPMVVDEKPTKAASMRGSTNAAPGRKTPRHISGKSGCETTQQDFYPHRRHIPKGGSTATVRHPKKAPRVYKRDDGEWLPPFRAPSPDMLAQQAPGFVLWQCPKKKTGKKAAPECVRRQGEWQPAFRSCDPFLVSVIPGENQRLSSRQGLKHCQCRPDEWCPPWKQQQQQTPNIDACDSLLQRNATISEDANCTHYLNDDERDGLGLQQERLAGAESTEEEDGEGEDGEEEDEDDEVRNLESANEIPSQKAVDDYYASACDACDEQQSGGAGRVPWGDE